MASLEITFQRGSVEYTITVDKLPNDVTDAEASNAADLLKGSDIVERNIGGSGVDVLSVVVISGRTVTPS